MSILDTAIIQLRRYIDHRLALQEPYRSTVAGMDGDLVYITRPGASIADAEPAAKVTSDLLAVGDEVMVQPVLGKPVVIGKVRRTAAPGTANTTVYDFSGGFGGRSGSDVSFETASTGSRMLPAGTYIWMGVTKLTAEPSGGVASGYLTMRRSDTDAELVNGGAAIVYPDTGGRWTCVTTRTGTLTVGSPTSMWFRAIWQRSSGTLIQNAAELSVLLFRTS